MTEVGGRIWLTRNERNFLGRGRIELLRHIDETGSIAKAAKCMKMSYKSAWDAVDAMNRNAGFLLVERTSGGRDGGGSRLTSGARKLIECFERIEAEHRAFLEKLGEEIRQSFDPS